MAVAACEGETQRSLPLCLPADRALSVPLNVVSLGTDPLCLFKYISWGIWKMGGGCGGNVTARVGTRYIVSSKSNQSVYPPSTAILNN